MATQRQQGELERTLGLPEVLAIGVGTMVGAGIFVFPGLAAGTAGPAATISFAIGMGIALLVALPASELGTAMPQSGGGYYFVSRSLGTLAGCAVGIGQGAGLIFASAFYLVGFGHYATDLLNQLGIEIGAAAVMLLALAAVVLLTVVSITGAEKTGKLQNRLVSVLLFLIVLFALYGLYSVIGPVEAAQAPDEFMPFGAGPVGTTAALVFTSYLGFVQIATVGGDVKDPGRNLPLGMIGSVIIVGVLYVTTIFISVSVFESQQLEALGETAMVEVARSLLGTAGAVVIIGCGLLATLSSANASIMSASRALYALSKDRLLPEEVGVVSKRFTTPHIALLLVGGCTALLVLVGGTEFLAEVASVLHLVMYGLICFALVKLRNASPAWYAPTFTMPGYPVLPVIGGIASFVLIAFMQPLSIVVGLGLLAATGGWYLYYARDVDLVEVETVEAPSVPEGVQILYPLSLPDPEELPTAVIELFDQMDVSLVGTYHVPRHTASEQARDRFGKEAQRDLNDARQALEPYAQSVDTRLVFTSDEVESINRIAAEEESDAVIIPKPSDSMRSVLVPIRSDVNLERIMAFVYLLTCTQELDVTLFHVAEEGEEEASDALLADAANRLEAAGLDSDHLYAETEIGSRPVRRILEAAHEYDAVVIGETEPSLRELVLGEIPERIGERSENPVFVVRKPEAEREE